MILFSKYENDSLTLTDKIQLMEEDLLQNGFDRIEMNGSSSNQNYAYMSETSDYVVVIICNIKSKRKYFCIMDKCCYLKYKNLIFSVLSNNYSIADNIEKTSEFRVMVYKKGIVDVHTPVWEMLVNKGIFPIVDHRYHSHGINIKDNLRPCTHEQNSANQKGVQSDDPIFKYKPEEDFNFTWYAFVYWKVMGIISQEEAFAYNLEKNM